jgi:hypothetical protein
MKINENLIASTITRQLIIFVTPENIHADMITAVFRINPRKNV